MLVDRHYYLKLMVGKFEPPNISLFQMAAIVIDLIFPRVQIYRDDGSQIAFFMLG